MVSNFSTDYSQRGAKTLTTPGGADKNPFMHGQQGFTQVQGLDGDTFQRLTPSGASAKAAVPSHQEPVVSKAHRGHPSKKPVLAEGQSHLHGLSFGQLQTYLMKANRGIQALESADIEAVVQAAASRAEQDPALPPHVYVVQQVLAQTRQNQHGVNRLIKRFLGRIQNDFHHQQARLQSTPTDQQPLVGASLDQWG